MRFQIINVNAGIGAAGACKRQGFSVRRHAANERQTAADDNRRDFTRAQVNGENIRVFIFVRSIENPSVFRPARQDGDALVVG